MDKRTYQREYARRRRHRAWLGKTQGARTCPAKLGRYGVCGAVLEMTTDGRGRLRVTCPRCERKRRGLCRDCGARVAGTIGRAIRCAPCMRLARRDSYERYTTLNRAKIRARSRQYAAKRDPVKRAEARRRYREAFPERVKRWKQRDAEKHPERVRQYHRRYNAWRANEKRQQARAAYYAAHPAPAPTCAHCTREIPWVARGMAGRAGRPPKRCVFCEARHHAPQLRAAIKRWVAHDERPATRGDAGRRPVVRGRAPKRRQPTRYTAAGERLCVTDRCTTVVRGRAKLCDACKTTRRSAARAHFFGERAA